MTATADQPVRKNAWPLRYMRHSFEAYWYNTLKCRIVYNDFNFTLNNEDKPSKPPPSANYRDLFQAGYGFVRNFPAPADVRWTSLDGTTHVAEVDIGAIFKDELVLHHVPKEDVADIYPQYGPEPGIILEVNDRSIYVYMRAMVATKSLREPGNKDSDYRDDLILVWSHTY